MDSTTSQFLPEKAVKEDALPPYVAQQSPEEVLAAQAREHKKRVRRRRCHHFTAFTLLLVAAFHIFGKRRLEVSDLDFSAFSQDTDITASAPSGCHENVSWNKTVLNGVNMYGPYHAQTSMELPLSADILSFIAEGAYSTGSIEVSQSCHSTSENAVVDVEVFYASQQAFDDVTVCSTHRSEREWGLGIFTPRWPHPHRDNMLRFDVRVRLPASETGSSLNLNSLVTKMPNFQHRVHKLAETTRFDKLVLETSNSQIDVDSAAANVVSVLTSNRPIHGSFNTSTAIFLRTSNAEIATRVNLFHTGDDDKPTAASIHTSNGAIDGTIGLYSESDDFEGGRFVVVADTTNAPASLAFVDAPLNARLHATARSSNKPVTVSAHAAFEGRFALRTSNAAPAVSVDREAEDPAGRGRERQVDVNAVGKSTVHGSVEWEQGNAKDGGVLELVTSNAPVQLKL